MPQGYPPIGCMCLPCVASAGRRPQLRTSYILPTNQTKRTLRTRLSLLVRSLGLAQCRYRDLFALLLIEPDDLVTGLEMELQERLDLADDATGLVSSR